MEKVETPMLEKMQEVREQSQIIGEFLDYMAERDTYMCEEDDDGNYYPTRRNTEQMLALFFEIDLVQAEKERGLLLEAVRNENN